MEYQRIPQTGNLSGRINAKNKNQSPTKTERIKPVAPRNKASSPGNYADLIKYQQTFGNQATGRFLQAKLTIGQPNDKYEQEADRVADQVMRMPDPQIQRAPT